MMRRYLHFEQIPLFDRQRLCAGARAKTGVAVSWAVRVRRRHALSAIAGSECRVDYAGNDDGSRRRYEFDRVLYDEDGDVLYLRRGPEQTAADTFGSPEGHAVGLDEHGEVIAITLVNAKRLSGRDGEMAVTLPSLMEADLGDSLGR